ncbi:OmpA family protein [Methylobacterium sp. NEAU 140]|uniref:OmpA family protein n=1 Tax=Methylobacterium sp. NEAU 140 TaxID=3064945 RepID=UPI0027327D2E|nr:OmpA family protein [Methylobacterium sp. NEAU 140]MDP4024928.1 OmpA family protein [Methylobacterium sp. NEAU 140]
MSISIRHPLALAVLVASTGGVLAGPAYKASDVVNHFSPQADLGSARALCIGTESDCAKQIPEPAAAKTRDGFNLRVNFDYNSANLVPDARANLDELVRALKDPRLASSRFVVEGHTDGTGSDAFNLDLSMRRAGSVVRYLTDHGVDLARLDAKGYGKQKPLVSDPLSPENRRVETRLQAE